MRRLFFIRFHPKYVSLIIAKYRANYVMKVIQLDHICKIRLEKTKCHNDKKVNNFNTRARLIKVEKDLFLKQGISFTFSLLFSPIFFWFTFYVLRFHMPSYKKYDLLTSAVRKVEKVDRGRMLKITAHIWTALSGERRVFKASYCFCPPKEFLLIKTWRPYLGEKLIAH